MSIPSNRSTVYEKSLDTPLESNSFMSSYYEREKFAELLLGRFSKKYEDSTVQARSFQNLTSHQQAAIAQTVKFPPDEAPLIACMESPEVWFLISTERLIWISGSDIHELRWDELCEVDSVEPGYAGKTTDPYLKLRDVFGREHRAKVGFGVDKYAIWWVLDLIIAAKNRAGLRSEMQEGGTVT